ncbi:phosphoribosylformylglycinamidine synthase subunit PurQ [bacterium]|nr:phosphoribosylformylglycinamidine synthase subunit PurQ [bacterium]
MKFGVVVFPGSNCDRDTFYVLEDIFEQEVNFLWHKSHDLKNVDCVILPGGFSYGDYLRPGAIASFSPLMQEVKEFALNGGLTVGICNGFQVLLELGLLQGAIIRNKNLKFLCQHVTIRLENDQTIFTNQGQKGDIYKMPIAHFDGSYYAPPQIIQNLQENHQIIFRYSDIKGSLTPHANVNGSLDHIAGVINKPGNVLGIMPHPERSSEALLGSKDGRVIFQSILNERKK